MPVRSFVIVLALASTACATLRASPAAKPLGDEGEVLVFLLPLPRDAERLSFTISGVSLLRADGGEAPLEVARPLIDGASGSAQQLLASGRVAPGDYAGVVLREASASVAHEDGPARLLVEPEATRAEIALHIAAGQAHVVWLRLGDLPVQRDFAFAPRFAAILPPQTPPQAGIYCTNTAGGNVTVVDRGSRLVTGTLPVVAGPQGIALDSLLGRAYVALPRADQVQVLDVGASATIGRIRLTPGDGPTELTLTPDGKLLVVNERSRTVSFVDPLAMSELSRVPVGDAPVAIVLDRAGRRAYVVNRGSSTISVLDVASAAVVATIATDPEPLRVQLSRDGSRLYVVQRGSMYLSSFALPSLAPLARGFIGLGAVTIKVDPRTDLVYLAREGEAALTVLEPVTMQIIDRFEVPGPVTYLAIDDVENALLAVVPGRRTVAVVDLTSRRVRAELPVGAEPHAIALSSERP
jgi:YVTN family beta-propeller protein